MLSICAQFDAELGCLLWWARVTSAKTRLTRFPIWILFHCRRIDNVQIRNQTHVRQNWPGIRDSAPTQARFVVGHANRMRGHSGRRHARFAVNQEVRKARRGARQSNAHESCTMPEEVRLLSASDGWSPIQGARKSL